MTGALRAAERVSAMRAVQQQRIQALGVRNGKVQVIQNGVDQAQCRHRGTGEQMRGIWKPSAPGAGSGVEHYGPRLRHRP